AAQGAYLWGGLKGAWERKPEKAVKSAQLFTRVYSIRTMAFSPDGARIALGCEWNSAKRNTAYVVDVPVGATRFTKPLDLPSGPLNTIAAVAWTPDGKQVVTVLTLNRPGVDPKALRAARHYDAAEGTLLRKIEVGPRDGSGLHRLNANEFLLTWFD